MSEPNNPATKNEDHWTDLINNLDVFTSATIKLVESLEDALETSKSGTTEALDENFLCACAILSESIVEFASKIPQNLIKPANQENSKGNDDSKARSGRKAKTPKPKLVKTAPEPFTKEKTDKLALLKENLMITQLGMTELQQQVAQLEKLYQVQKKAPGLL